MNERALGRGAAERPPWGGRWRRAGVLLRLTRPGLKQGGAVGVLLIPAGLMLGLSLESGGFFPDACAVAAIVIIVVLSIRTLALRGPFAGMGAAVSWGAAALMAFTTWTLASGAWSHAPARATFEYDRALLYTSLFVLVGAVGRSALRAGILLYGLTLVSAGTSILAAVSWLAPDLLPVASAAERQRLSWPTSYWNATGLVAALALVWACSLSCSARARPSVRVLATMTAPLATATLVFSASRGALAVAVLGLVIAVVTIRASATPGGIAALAPAIALAAAIALHVSGLDVPSPLAPALARGHRAALELFAVALAAGALRGLFLRLDSRLAAMHPRLSRATSARALAAVAGLVLVALLLSGAPSVISRDIHQFVSPIGESVGARVPPSQRFTRLGSNGRIQEWRVAFKDGFLRHPVGGTGAGTYELLWTRYAPSPARVLDAHSVYVEVLAELGIVGAVLLVGVFLAMLIALARRARGPEREVWAALMAGAVMYVVHTGVDWDWEMPAVTAWFFAAGALALAAPADRPRGQTTARLRAIVSLGSLLLVITPVLVWRSQTQLARAVRAFEHGDCLTAESAALSSNGALSSRADPFEVIAYCEAGARRFSLALAAIVDAERRDPGNWELRYSEALISAAAGIDPQPAAEAALALYPTSPLVQAAARAFATGGPASWQRYAFSAPLPLQNS